MKHQAWRNIVFIAGAMIAAAGSADAQPFPSRPITVIVGYSAGGQADALTRRVGQQLGETLKTSVIVENKPGANALLAAQFVASAPADGHTILLVTDSMTTIDPQLPGGSGFDPDKAFDLVVNLAKAPLLLAARKDLPVDSLRSLVEYGKANPTALSFGTSGPTSPHRLSGEMLKQLGGFPMTHVAYRGTAASVNDLAGGHIPLVVGAATALVPLAESGKIKLIAVTSEKRLDQLPGVPAVAETYPGFNILSYMGFAVPKGTPAAVVDRLNAEINRLIQSADMKEFFLKQGMIPAGGSTADFRAQIATDYAARGKIIREMKISAE